MILIHTKALPLLLGMKGGEQFMKKILAIIFIAMVATVFALAGCQKQEAPKPAEQSAPTTTMTMPMTSTTATTATAPEHK
jgi:preprotein translocase subunit SecG